MWTEDYKISSYFPWNEERLITNLQVSFWYFEILPTNFVCNEYNYKVKIDIKIYTVNKDNTILDNEPL